MSSLRNVSRNSVGLSRCLSLKLLRMSIQMRHLLDTRCDSMPNIRSDRNDMQYAEFVEIVKNKNWSIAELRCDVQPTNELLQFIELVGSKYEAFLVRYLRIETKALHMLGNQSRIDSDTSTIPLPAKVPYLETKDTFLGSQVQTPER